MIEFGKTLREAREAKGYSVSQLAEITHILPQIIENLEKEDFTRIVAPIYGRGFVKLYCETVGLEAQPLVSEFMEIYNGNRPPVIRMKEDEAPAPAPQMPTEECEPMATPIANEPPAEEEAPASAPPTAEKAPAPPAFNFDPLPEPPPVVREPLSRPSRAPAPFSPGSDDLPFPEDKPEPRRDYRLPGHSMPDVPRSVWRFGILLAAAAVVLALIFFSCRALYRMTMQAPMPDKTGEVADGGDGKKAGDGLQPEAVARNTPASGKQQSVSARKPAAKGQPPATPRKPVAVPPLYID